MVPRSLRAAVGAVTGLLASRQTYANLLYVVLSIPLGLAYSFVLFFGLVVGLLLTVVGVGIPILAATVLGARAVAGFERGLANALLDLDLEPAADVGQHTSEGPLASVGAYLDAASTWRSLGFVSIKVYVAIVAFVPVFLLATAWSLLLAPLRYPYAVELVTVNGEPVVWSIDAAPEAAAAVLAAVGLGVGALGLADVLAYVSRRIAVALLGEPDSTDGAGSLSTGTTEPTTGD